MIESIEAALFPIVCKINEYLSNYILVFLLLGIGFWYSIKTRFVQIRCFKEGWNSVFGNLSLRGKKHDSGMSSFQALATAIAAQVGTGNIVGASGAILTGGPGAIFWMWLIAFFGMATIYAEATLAQETRIVEKDGNVKGGPVYYITTAFKGGFGKFLAGFFAIAITLALGFFGCMVQSNSIGSTMQTAFGVPSWIVGLVLVAICGFIFLGGVQRLASVTEKVVPIMAAIFLLGGLIVLIARIKYVPATFGKILAGFFALAIIFALGFTGNMVQSNAISNAFQEALGIPTWIVGVVLAVVAAFIFLGGVTRIAAVTEKLVPVMACFYLVGGLVMLIANITNLPHAFALIFEGAFNPQAILGGAVGIGVREAMRYGVARGLFSNEAGMGSTPHAHAMAKVEKPQDQGVVAMVCVFIDTFVVLTITALVMITSGALNVGNMAANPAAENMAQVAFSTVFGSFGNFYVAICLLFFAFSTIIGWYFFGEQNVKYLFGVKAVKVYACIAVVCVALGAVLEAPLVWNLSDLFNALMVFPNLLALLALSGLVAKAARGGDTLRK